MAPGDVHVPAIVRGGISPLFMKSRKHPFSRHDFYYIFVIFGLRAFAAINDQLKRNRIHSADNADEHLAAVAAVQNIARAVFVQREYRVTWIASVDVDLPSAAALSLNQPDVMNALANDTVEPVLPLHALARERFTKRDRKGIVCRCAGRGCRCRTAGRVQRAAGNRRLIACYRPFNDNRISRPAIDHDAAVIRDRTTQGSA